MGFKEAFLYRKFMIFYVRKLSNISYFLKTSTKTYILRVFKSKQSVNISREFEYKIQKEAYKKGISSKVLFFSENFMIYEFIEGLHKSKIQTVDIKNLA